MHDNHLAAQDSRATDREPTVEVVDATRSLVRAQSSENLVFDDTTANELADWESAYLMRLQSHRMRAISEALMRPLDTRARELKARALEAYEHGWLDDAYRDLTESAELNRYDFTIHQALGNIALAHRDDPDEAERHYAAAAKYAGPKSPADAAYALLSLASVAESKGDTASALRRAEEALDVSDGIPEAHYAIARYLSATDGPAADIADHLESAFRGKVQLCAHAAGDTLLSGRGEIVGAALRDYLEMLQDCVRDRVDALTEALFLLDETMTRADEVRIGQLREEMSALLREVKGAEAGASALVLADLLVTLRRKAAPLVAEAARVVREVSVAIEAEEARVRIAAETQSGEIQGSRFLYIIGGAIVLGGAALGVQMAFPNLSEAMVCTYPFLVMLGGLAGGLLNRHQAHAERGRAEGLEHVHESLDTVVARLDALRESLRAGLSPSGGRGPEGASVKAEGIPA